ncbi:MAG TPA: YceI family protein [Acidimicrobiales bacterium]|nr:YceI family protein [Acidimicrobiales bacterium]
MSTLTTTTVPGYIAGTWDIDPVHTEVGFSVRHLMVSKVRGRFTKFEGELVTAGNPLESSVTATIDLDSIVTGDENRDGHLRSGDFFDVANHPVMTWRSTGVRQAGDRYVVDGELTLHGVTRNVPLDVELNGFIESPMGTRVGFSATGELSRKDFGIDIDMPLDGGGVVIGDKVSLNLEVEAILRTA